jgi:hypothetical protein
MVLVGNFVPMRGVTGSLGLVIGVGSEEATVLDASVFTDSLRPRTRASR